MLQLEIQVFGNWLCQVLHTEPVHDGETMSWRCQSREKAAEHGKIIIKKLNTDNCGKGF